VNLKGLMRKQSWPISRHCVDRRTEWFISGLARKLKFGKRESVYNNQPV
jgi:hypothetical protein